MGNWDHCLQRGALSDIGLRRANNQDSMTEVIADTQKMWRQRGHLFMVADGMGAHAAGELASKLAVDAVALTYPKLLDKPPPEALVTALLDANAQIHSRGQANLDFRGMGTTCTALVLLPQGALLAQVGDSRAYRLRDERFEQMTFDHSLVWEMRAARQITDDDFSDYVPKNVITRSLGPNARVEIDREGPFPVQIGDTFLLCTDGLSGPVEDHEIGTILGCLPPQEAAQALVDLANLRGGPDNITVIVVHVAGPLVAQSTGSGPDAASGPLNARPVHPLIWKLLGVSGLGAVAAAVMAYWGLALICLVAAAVSGMMAWVQRCGASWPSTAFDGRPLGKGPYSTCDCPANHEFLHQAMDTVEQLRDAAAKEDWQVDWSRFNGFLDRAAAAERSADYAGAIAEHFRAIGFVMAQLRHQDDRGSDSGVLDL